MPVTELTRAEFEARALLPGVVALVVFYADWCAPSRTQLKVVESLAGRFEGRAFLGVVHVDREPELSDAYQTATLPTSVLLCDGEIVEILPGYQQEEFLKSYLDQVIANSAAAPGPPGS